MNDADSQQIRFETLCQSIDEVTERAKDLVAIVKVVKEFYSAQEEEIIELGRIGTPTQKLLVLSATDRLEQEIDNLEEWL